MGRSIVIVGDSPLSLLVARHLDKELARQAHVKVTLISRDDHLIYWPNLKSLLGRHEGKD